jgi:[glutamine synthetase] adenylyltransferase / [glutamine synthetase]-adenylyl-L-tyrosine phosphorylase
VHRLSCPAVTQALAAEHERRLGERYRTRFTTAHVRAHIAALAGLSPGRPVAVSVRPLGGDRVSCTVVAFDYPAEFSLITGMLSASGVSIVSGDAFTWSPALEGTPPELARRRIVDVFVGESVELSDPDTARAIEERLEAVIAPLEAGTEEALTRARRTVNEMAAAAIAREPGPLTGELHPVEIEVRPTGTGRLAMVVTAQDTPFFLYTFSTALSLQGVAIEGVAIRTEAGRIEDSFEVADMTGRTFDDPGRIDRIRLAVLLTKQFTAFLGRAPDPLAALSRFEQLVSRVLEAPGQGRWLEVLANGGVLADLARLLGASTFLWEDFVRQQYETLLPMLRPHVAGRRFAGPSGTIAERLDRHLAAPSGPEGGGASGPEGGGASGPEAFSQRLNAFKDREIFLYDLDHLLTPGFDFRELSRCLTALAEAVVDRAVRFAHRTLSARFGEPRTVAGMPARLAVLGLGKMGGAALGYASDIELLFVYSDAGATAGAGEGSLDNAEFFDRLAREVVRLVRAKREGIFHLDLRLRPHGQAGPLASSLGAFCAYYAPGGTADAWERLALVRLRAVAGDPGLGARVERLRDELVYAAPGPDPASLRRLRERQIIGAVPQGRLNAKYSPGALVDLEYAVQALQILHGGAEPRLRTPRIHEALAALADVGALEPGESGGLADSYRFFRLLINGLRMLRGSARDLLIPPAGDDELLHLARRMGYGPGPGLDPARALALDMEMHTAFVRAFLERRFGRDAVPGPVRVGVADLVLSDEVPDDVGRETLARRGFRDPARALANLRSLAGAGAVSAATERRPAFARLAVLACDLLAGMPDPDMALNNWERFLAASAGTADRPEASLAQPMRLEILLSLCSASQFLADTLIADPPLLDWLGAPGVLAGGGAADVLRRELADRAAATAGDATGWREALRAVRRREILRIGARDVCLGVSTRRVMEDLSDLADALIAAALARAAADEGPRAPALCVLALGKLGARELNYSSDVDLLCLCGHELEPGDAERAGRIIRRMRADLSDRTAGGHAGRVDLRLRPWDGAGELVTTGDALRHYYERSAGLWELQAMLQARAVAGDLAAGERFIGFVHGLVARPRGRDEVVASLVRSRRPAPGREGDLKSGPGGIRDVEFLVQSLRLLHAQVLPELVAGGTLPALAALTREGILPAGDARELEADYLFFRRTEHFLQLYEDRQVHRLPRDPVELRALARRMLGSGATAEGLLAEIDSRSARVRRRFEEAIAAASTRGGSPP